MVTSIAFLLGNIESAKSVVYEPVLDQVGYQQIGKLKRTHFKGNLNVRQIDLSFLPRILLAFKTKQQGSEHFPIL